MPGSSQRRGAVRRTESKKGATVGSGGQRRKGLQGRGPTPKASERTKHPAARVTRASTAQRTPRRAGPNDRRPKASSEIVAGRNAVLEALRAGLPITTMYVAGRVDADNRVREALKIAVQQGIPVLETPRGELDRLTDGAVHQGLAVQVPPYTYADPADLVNPEAPGIPLVVALDGITDPRNLGAIVRSVAAFGGHGVVVPERRSAGVTAVAWKASAGAVARVPVAAAVNLNRTLKQFRDAGFFVVGLDMDGDVELPGLDLADQPLVVVIGSEGKGLSRLVRESCDQIVSIPMNGEMESLNAGVATGVALYEIARARATVAR